MIIQHLSFTISLHRDKKFEGNNWVQHKNRSGQKTEVQKQRCPKNRSAKNPFSSRNEWILIKKIPNREFSCSIKLCIKKSGVGVCLILHILLYLMELKKQQKFLGESCNKY